MDCTECGGHMIIIDEEELTGEDLPDLRLLYECQMCGYQWITIEEQ